MSTETDKIEHDIETSRTRLNDTIEQLGGKLSPGQMLDEAMGLLKGQTGEFAVNLGRQVKENPLPLLLIAAGVGVMAMKWRKEDQGGAAQKPDVSDDEGGTESRYRPLERARSSVTRMANEDEDVFADRLHQAEAEAMDLKQDAGEVIGAFKERVRAAGHSLHETARSVRGKMDAGLHAAGAYMSHTADNAKAGIVGTARSVKGGMGDAKHKAQAFYDEYPLAAGAIGLAVGALIGATAPLSRMERDNLSGVADAAARRGADMAERSADFVSEQAAKAAAALH